MNIENKTITRNQMLDFIKGLAIILVVIGHTIQCTHGESQELGLFYSNPVFSFIYSFHMPLFMLVAGYLFFYSMSKYDTKSLIIRRIKTTVIPILVWATFNEIYTVFIRGERFVLVDYILRISGVLWFLWAVFLCSLGVIIGKRIFKDRVIFHVIILIALVILPDQFDKHLYGFMYPYFVIGYYFNKYKDRFLLNARSNKTLIVVLILYIVLMLFWNKEAYIYISYLSVYHSDNVIKTIAIDLYRWAVGLVGSCSVILIIDRLYPKIKDTKVTTIMAYLGKESLGLYILSAYISNYILLRITFFANWNVFAYTLICIPLSAIIIIGSVAVIKVVQKFKLVNFLLFGGR